MIPPSTSGRPALVPPELLLKVERMALLARSRVRGSIQGKRRSGRTGSSMEFADYRAYAPGDELRKLDWHAYAKTGRPYIKVYMDEQELPVSLYVDASASMGFTGADPAGDRTVSKDLYARRLAACVGYAALCGYDSVNVQVFGESVTARQPVLRGKGSLHRLLEFLSQDRLEPRGDLASVFMKPAYLPSRPGQAWIFSDFLFPSGVEESILALLAARQEVRVVQVLSQEEWEPSLAGDLRLIDVESGEGKEVAVSAGVLGAYREALRRYTAGLEAFCRERGVAYALVLTSTPLEETLLKSLRHEGFFQS
ncbi:DUF58 domain-containing protein [Gorillibacterium sp. sgz5001074]|uniref:DUF58 domain-containing protein n=1 Tax=Gorillibacterium sp. sgz5001074 TaxID=3446695 RepID=UPI003F66DA1B